MKKVILLLAVILMLSCSASAFTVNFQNYLCDSTFQECSDFPEPNLLNQLTLPVYEKIVLSADQPVREIGKWCPSGLDVTISSPQQVWAFCPVSCQECNIECLTPITSTFNCDEIYNFIHIYSLDPSSNPTIYLTFTLEEGSPYSAISQLTFFAAVSQNSDVFQEFFKNIDTTIIDVPEFSTIGIIAAVGVVLGAAFYLGWRKK
jgi:hypothetical protein